jgi:hypothetical protein
MIFPKLLRVLVELGRIVEVGIWKRTRGVFD